MNFPAEYDYLEEMADEAGNYMTEAVNTYNTMYGTDDGYNVNLEEYADEKVAKQNKETAINLFKNAVPIETIIKSVPSLPAEFIERFGRYQF